MGQPTISQATRPPTTPHASSMSGYRTEIGVWHVRHRPRRATQLNTGTSSYHWSGVSQFGQCEPGCTIDSWRGTRYNTTLRNDPNNAPSTAAKPMITASRTLPLKAVPGLRLYHNVIAPTPQSLTAAMSAPP